MNTLRDRLRAKDPLEEDSGLSPSELTELRHRLVAEAAQRSASRTAWREALALAAAVGVMVAVGVATGRRLPPATGSQAGVAEPVQRREPRQLQFSAPGGTRIIWTFDPDFSVTETIP